MVQWLVLSPHSEKVSGPFCEECAFSPCVGVSSGCSGFPPQTSSLHYRFTADYIGLPGSALVPATSKESWKIE